MGQYPAGVPTAFTAINPLGSALPYDSDPSQGIRARNVSGASTATGYSLADPYSRPQRDSSLSANANLAHRNSTTSNQSTSNAVSSQSYGRYESSPYNPQKAPAMDSPGSMYDSIFENVLANSSSTSLPHPQGQKSTPLHLSADREDAESPPPEYSTYAPHDPLPSETARVYASGSLNRLGAPALPEIVRDVGGLRLFDDASGADGRGAASQFNRSTDSPGAMHASPSHHSSGQQYEDELRGKHIASTCCPILIFLACGCADYVHPVGIRQEVYGARNHRRQMSNSSIISTGSVQSGYGLAQGGANPARGSNS